MTLREALDLLELNERTLEQSMLESSLQNRLEHTELRHVLRVFEAYRKVNAFLNPSFNTQGDARMTIIDESVPGGPVSLDSPMLEVTKSAVPLATGSAAAVTATERDTFSDTMIETWAASDAAQLESKSTLPLEAAPRNEGVNLFVMLGLVAAAFSVGMVVLGPTMSLIFKPSALSARRPAPTPSISSLAPVVTPPPVAPVTTRPPVASVTQPPVAPVAQPASPVTVTVKPASPAAPIKPVTPAITKPVVRPAVTAKPSVAVALVKPRVTVTPRAQPRVTAPRVTAPRVLTQPRAASRRAALTPQTSSRAAMVAAPPRRTVNQRQFTNWDNSGVVLRYRSWTLVPDAVRGLSTNAFRAAVFVARDPASLPDIPR